jgi:CDP-glycerol glycerophosphotransferase (TagB/SpsB family)
MLSGKTIIFLKYLLAYSLSKVVRFVPRDKKKWAFGAMGGFRDNPKFMFYDVIEKHPEIQVAWIAFNYKDYRLLKKQGLSVYHKASLKGLWYALTAGVYIVDHSASDVNVYLDAGAFYVNLWHGSSVKRVRWQNKAGFVRDFNLKDEDEMNTSLLFRIRQYPILFRKIDLCLAPSSIQLKDFFAPMMNIPEQNCIVGIYPRSKLMIKGKESALRFIRNYEPEETLEFVKIMQSYHKSYIYMPTWRNGNNDFIKCAGIDWEELNNAMVKKDSLFILKLHPLTVLNVNELAGYSNILLYPRESDVYTVLPFIDCLITDYSSIYTDFLMMNKEIILFTFDYDEYVAGSYELSEYDKYFVGKRASDFHQLLQIMESNEDCHVSKDKYEFLMDFFWSCNKYNIDIAEEIKKRIGFDS